MLTSPPPLFSFQTNSLQLQLFPALSTTQLFGLLEGRFVWVPADERTAKLLEGACVGATVGGARAAADAAGAAVAVFGEEAVAAAVSAERGGACVCVRLSLEEAVFLVHVLGTLKVVVEQEMEKKMAAESGEKKKEKEKEKEKKKKSGEEGEGEGEEQEEKEEEEPPDRVAREMHGEDLWRYACLKSMKSDGSNISGSGNGNNNHVDDVDDDDEAFLRSYVAFHHFRCKGWTVRSGLRYGCDFVLYQGHPASSHADVCVLAVRRRGGGGSGGKGRGEGGRSVIGKDGDGGVEKNRNVPSSFSALGECPSRQAAPLTWLDVEIGNRLAAQVGKRLLLLHVEVGRGGGDGSEVGGGGSEDEKRRKPFSLMTAAEALSRVTVEERLVERWVPDVDREEPVV